MNQQLGKNNILKQGLVDIWIDEVVPCLRDTTTNELVDTEVFGIPNKKILRAYSKKSGWHIDWAKVPDDADVFGLSVKGEKEIQGLISLKNVKQSSATYIHWACVAPSNNKHDFGVQKYTGVGGHLFAIAVDMSVKWGYDGFVYGYAANPELLQHYEKCFGAKHLGILHPYHFYIGEKEGRKILEVYKYGWRIPVA